MLSFFRAMSAVTFFRKSRMASRNLIRSPQWAWKAKSALLCVLAFAFFDAALGAAAHPFNPELKAARWPASWIASPSSPAKGPGVFYFRREISLDAMPAHFWVHVSADNRFVLHVNGSYVAEGPARGDLFHWRFETVDLAPFLHTGKNVIAAVVWNFGELSPVAQMSSRTGFLMQGDTKAEAAVNTGPEWRVRREEGRAALGHAGVRGYYAAGPGERVDGRVLDWNWDQMQTGDEGWETPRSLGAAAAREATDSPNSWELMQDPLPPMEHYLTDAGGVVRAEGLPLAPDFPQSPLSIPPHTHVVLLLDHHTLQTAYPELSLSGGRNAELKLTYSEALYNAEGQKGNRDEIAGRHIEGISDEFISGGGDRQVFAPLWWRTWRYLQLDVTTQEAPLRLDGLRAWFTAYPFEAKATIRGDIPRLDQLWETGWRTARLNAHETYMDASYWEQLQYVGDARIQALISYAVSGDPRLARQAITNIDDSRVPEGITQSRYPSALPQFIPTFSLIWVNMLHDYWMYVDDPGLVRETAPHTRPVLDWYASHLRQDGLLGKVNWWEFADWTAGYRYGMPPQDADGGSTYLTLQFISALKDAAEMEALYGSDARAIEYEAMIRKASRALNRETWDARHGLYADTPAEQSWSQEANVLAVMLGVAPPQQRAQILRRLLGSNPQTVTQIEGTNVPPMSPLSYYFRFYLSRALTNAGLGDLYLSQLGPWYKMLDLGLSTWAETPEPARSDCHAWSASPNYDLLTLVAGIHPGSAGFGSVTIAPHLKGLNELDATMPTPRGMIHVAYRLTTSGWNAMVQLPKGVTGSLVWKNVSHTLHPGTQQMLLPYLRE
jgi:alpha-L-rhamnosidase